jgi:hypothetical protein
MLAKGSISVLMALGRGNIRISKNQLNITRNENGTGNPSTDKNWIKMVPVERMKK